MKKRKYVTHLEHSLEGVVVGWEPGAAVVVVVVVLSVVGEDGRVAIEGAGRPGQV